MTPAITVTGLTKTYGQHLAVDHISFSVATGSITALLGGNGAGKTTTISMMLGTLIPSAGRVIILGRDMAHDRFAALAQMNFSSPYVDLPKKLSVRQILKIYGDLYNVANIKNRITEIAQDLDLSNFLDRAAGQLSAGQQTRVSLAKSMINTPRVLLLDEPTASLDPDTADKIRQYLDRERKRTGMTIVLASHNMREVERLCDHVIMMKQGRIIATGTPADLMQRLGQKDMEEVFLTLARGEQAP
jgi:ABC-2 type transport system ATP-binding protein